LVKVILNEVTKTELHLDIFELNAAERKAGKARNCFTRLWVYETNRILAQADCL
jgi:hypothetical protein